VPNPVGDADHRPFGEAEVVALLEAWLPERPGLIDDAVRTSRELPGMPQVGDALRALAGEKEKEQS
jgi:hypothetical protein